MRCAAVRKRFSADLDGQLSPSERAVFGAHLSGCAPCADRRERFGAVLAEADRGLAARAVPVPPLSAVTAARLEPVRPFAIAPAVSWGVSLAVLACFGWMVAGGIRRAGAGAGEGLSTWALHATAWGILYVVLAGGIHALFFTRDILARLHGRLLSLPMSAPRSVWTVEPAGVRLLGVALVGYGYFAARWYGGSIFWA